MQITKDLLKEWSACSDGYKWFLTKFPTGEGEYGEIIGALYEAKRAPDARWLASKCFDALRAGYAAVEVSATEAMIGELMALKPDIEGAEVGSAKNSQLAASGNYSQLAASGNYSKLAASGNYSQLAASGYGSQLAASGNYSQLAASGNYSKLAASGYGSKLAASGKNAVVVCAGSVAEFTLGEGGCIALPYHDGNRVRFATAYVGENGIEAGVKYHLNAQHQFEMVSDANYE